MNLQDFYQFLDDVVESNADADDLFASSYIRGFVSLHAAAFGDESQPLSQALASKVSEELVNAKNELTPQDQAIVAAYWQTLTPKFSA
ncbi:YfcL family protein [Thalassotalea agarivorans]|uniref:YfcL protein n=1 Tax=Thalassotalea agarivorans TaxID=349064 RepID=A0A1H9ZNS6_THASX|nr:YfcL family protein [Thalassotalea agarivorans]SES82849.1 YfcL protein [Thalassotalea agarivorans]